MNLLVKTDTPEDRAYCHACWRNVPAVVVVTIVDPDAPRDAMEGLCRECLLVMAGWLEKHATPATVDTTPVTP